MSTQPETSATIADFKFYADFQRFNFFRRPTWRWERVLRLAERFPTPGRCSKRDDQFVRTARNFILRYRNRDLETDREELWFDHPGLYYAYQFYFKQQDPEGQGPAAYLQARILSGQSFDEVAKAMNLTPDTVRWYEALFFNVADRLLNRDWITDQVIIPAFRRLPVLSDDDAPRFQDSTVAQPFLDGSLKLFSYFGGPLVADAMISGMRGGNILSNRDDYEQWMDKAWSDAVRRRSAQAALAFEVNKFNVMELFAVHTRIIEIERSADSQDQQRTTTERHIKALIEEIPFVSGQDGQSLTKNTLLGRLDEMPAELRDDEVLRISSGEAVPDLRDNFPDRLPPPRKQKQAILTAQPKLDG